MKVVFVIANHNLENHNIAIDHLKELNKLGDVEDVAQPSLHIDFGPQPPPCWDNVISLTLLLWLPFSL